MTERRDVRIEVPVLARVEGEGALSLEVREGRIERLQLRIYEPPRLFEKLLEGRGYEEIPDAVARICGICPVAYQMSAVAALEQAMGVAVDDWVRRMRRVFYCGEWLQSHALHIHLLAAPDFLGYDSVVEMAKGHPELVRRGLRLQALGNDLIALFGGRSVHPVGACVGGFHHAPTVAAVAVMRARLNDAQEDALALLDWALALPVPDSDQDFVSVALRHPQDYAMAEGRIVSDRGLDIGAEAFEAHFRELQVPHSTALHALLHDEPYMVGPLARLNLNHERLPQALRERLLAGGLRLPSRNPFHSLIARAAEIAFIVGEAERLLADYAEPPLPAAAVTPRAGVGFGATEAPRGLLWHRYEMNEAGHVCRARIVPPTSQNQARIEADLRQSLELLGLDQPDEALRLRGEQVIRSYDPCISCATHFLRLDVRRE
ncbi:Ni/Fe hydrogenase subunit alpha [Acidihalobacter prosperus]|uniref:Hydrogenase/sulfur reductase, alpha subunit n=1 Tax=Acidihalobacter prosperus TaxID=160660 RepID=A0A1A6C2Q2_9GAMM|nr:nickel-dependent hydrogenase large subunit [Acidihalobacter prosperus]OBS08829.1 hydrogenase/sulfur reductase, alpha subunit [Acidihalobacter prosperus]